MPRPFDFQSSPCRGGDPERERRRLALRRTLGAVLAVLVALAVPAGQARASGGPSAAQDQYAPSKVVTPPSQSAPTQQFTPPGSAKAVPSTSGTLPFTGLSLEKLVLIGAALLALGFLLRRGLPRRGP